MLKKRYDNIKFDNIDLRQTDYLGNYVYADNLFKKMDDYYKSDSNTPLYIAVTGTWGSGKTTVVNTAIKMLEEKYEKDMKKFVYDAWKYEGDSFRRTFTKCILDGSGIEKKSKEYKEYYNKLYDDKSIETESLIERINLSKTVSSEFDNKYLYVPIVLLFLLIIALLIINRITTTEVLKTISNCIIWIVGFIYGCKFLKDLVEFFSKYLNARVTYVFQKLFSPEQFYETVNELLKKVKEDKKLILIDNIDRCDGEELKNTISSIKGFFDDDGKVIYIIPFDLQQVKSVYASDYNSYSEKVFDYVLDLKEKSAKNIIDFMDDLIKNESGYKDLFTNSSSEIIALSECKTPRQILNICNDYITEYNILIDKNNLNPSDIQQDDLNYLMKYTIIKRFYNEDFRIMHLNSDYIKEIEIRAKSRMQYVDVQRDFHWLSNNTYTFLKSTSSIIPSNYNYFYSSQSNDDFDIDDNLRQMIDSEEFEQINKIIVDSKIQRDTILNYLSNRIKYDKIRKSWKPSIVSKLKLIIFLMRENTITYEDYRNYFDFISNDDLISNIINPLEIDYQDITYFANEISVNKKRPLSVDIFDSAMRGYMGIPDPDRIKVLSYYIGELKIKKLTKDQEDHINTHVDNLINMHNFSSEENVIVFKSNNINCLRDDILLRLLDSINNNDINCLNSIFGLVGERCCNDVKQNIFSSFINLVNRIDKNQLTTEHLDRIFELLDSCKNIVEYKNDINRLSIINVSNEKISDNTIEYSLNLLEETNLGVFSNLLLSLNTDEKKKKICQLINEKAEVNIHIIELFKQVVSRMTESQLTDNIDVSIDMYEKHDDNYRSWFKQFIFNSYPTLIDTFYSGLKNNYYKDDFAGFIVTQPLSFDQKIQRIVYYMTSNERFNMLLDNENNLLNLEKIMSNSDKHYKKITFARIINVLEGKANIVSNDIDCIVKLLENEGKNISLSQIKELLKCIGVDKTNNDDLHKLFNALPENHKSFTKEYDAIKEKLANSKDKE